MMTELDGTVTMWTKSGTTWTVSSVADTYGTTASYTDNASGLPTSIVAVAPLGMSCTAPTTTRGCRSMSLTYTTVTVGGVAKTRLAGVSVTAWNPAISAMATVQLAAYSYDGNGMLYQEWDPRITPALKTTYTYDSDNRLATLTPPGQATWSFAYNESGQLVTESRPDPSGGTATSTVVYNVPASGSGAPIDLSSATTATWGQTATLIGGTAIFGPNRMPAGTTADAVTTADWPYASVDYLDVNGQTTNHAQYGAGAWQYDAAGHSATGLVSWSLTAANRAQAISPTTYTDSAVAALTSSTARAAALSTLNAYDPLHPDRLVDTRGPVHPVVLVSGTTAHARRHVVTVYDEGNPNDGTDLTGLPTTIKDSVQDLGGVDYDAIKTLNGYAPNYAGDASGWVLGQPTTVTVQMGASPSAYDVVTMTRYNGLGQVMDSRLPGGKAGGTAQTTLTSHYGATGTGPCVSPDQAGLDCSTASAAQPAGQALPTTTYTYNMYGDVLTKTETVGTTVRTTTNTYDAADRPTGVSEAVVPAIAGGTAVPDVTYGYDPATGLPTTTTAAGQTLTTAYNTVGEVTSYTDANGTVTSSTYDSSGRPASVNDGKGTTTYGYDTATEHRGLVTSEDVGAGTAPSTFAATYSADGLLESETYPNGLVAWSHYNNAGQATSLVYAKGGTTWPSYLADYEARGYMADQTGSGGNQYYHYDNDGRLTAVKDIAATSPTTAACTTRSYVYDLDSNRTGYKSYPDGSGGTTAAGSCSTSTTPTVNITSTFDTADRITNTGYTYDTLGRTLTAPAVDAVGTGSKAGITGVLTVGYFANDMVAKQTQGAATRTFTLDPRLDRIASVGDGTTTTVNHYGGDGDSSSWSATGAAWVRNLCGPDGALAGTQTDGGVVTWQLTDLHGDIAATANDDPAATSPAAQFGYTEYGQPKAPAAAPDVYGWLGTHQRSTQPLAGLLLMGVRLYNPATGRFLTTDPIPGGNANPYTYPTNPINGTDISGMFSAWWRHTWRLSKGRATTLVHQLENGGRLSGVMDRLVQRSPLLANS